MAEPRDNRQADQLLARLDQIINMKHPLVLLAEKIDWQFLDGRFSTVCTPGPDQPPLRRHAWWRASLSQGVRQDAGTAIGRA